MKRNHTENVLACVQVERDIALRTLRDIRDLTQNEGTELASLLAEIRGLCDVALRCGTAQGGSP
jgi:hypothetical protein